MDFLLVIEKLFENFPLGFDATLLLLEGAEATSEHAAGSTCFGAIPTMLDGHVMQIVLHVKQLTNEATVEQDIGAPELGIAKEAALIGTVG